MKCPFEIKEGWFHVMETRLYIENEIEKYITLLLDDNYPDEKSAFENLPEDHNGDGYQNLYHCIYLDGITIPDEYNYITDIQKDYSTYNVLLDKIS